MISQMRDVRQSKTYRLTDAAYLTDRHNFRVYLGKLDEGDPEWFSIKCDGDKITTIKESAEGINIKQNAARVLDKRVFSLAVLKERHVFE